MLTWQAAAAVTRNHQTPFHAFSHGLIVLNRTLIHQKLILRPMSKVAMKELWNSKPIALLVSEFVIVPVKRT